LLVCGSLVQAQSSRQDQEHPRVGVPRIMKYADTLRDASGAPRRGPVGVTFAVDADGVALAAVQALYRLVREKEARLQAQQERIIALERHMEELRARSATGSRGGPRTARSICGWRRLVENFEAEFFDDRVGEHLAGDLLDALRGFFAGDPFQLQDEEFALADGGDLRVSERGQGMLDGLALRIKDGLLGHDPDVSFHR
jgi:hypothetical protein